MLALAVQDSIPISTTLLYGVLTDHLHVARKTQPLRVSQKLNLMVRLKIPGHVAARGGLSLVSHLREESV